MRFLTLLTSFVLLGSLLQAAELEIEGQFSRATAPSMKNGVVFMTIRNKGSETISLIAAQGQVADRIELHTHSVDDQGIMRMRELEEGIPLPSKKTTSLQPGGLHVMMMGLTKQLKRGESFELELQFSDGSATPVIVPILSAGAVSNDGHSMMQTPASDEGSASKSHETEHVGSESKQGSASK